MTNRNRCGRLVGAIAILILAGGCGQPGTARDGAPGPRAEAGGLADPRAAQRLPVLAPVQVTLNPHSASVAD